MAQTPCDIGTGNDVGGPNHHIDAREFGDHGGKGRFLHWAEELSNATSFNTGRRTPLASIAITAAFASRSF